MYMAKQKTNSRVIALQIRPRNQVPWIFAEDSSLEGWSENCPLLKDNQEKLPGPGVVFKVADR